MKLSNSLVLSLILATTAGTTMAQNAPLTRAEVKAQLVEAIRTGDLLANGESGLKLNEINPSKYPAKSVSVGKTRAQVQAELAEAIRTGNLLASGESGLRLNEVNPSKYPAKAVLAGNSRAQVLAELNEAKRLGLLNVVDNDYPVAITPEQVEQIRQAGLSAGGGEKFGLLTQQ